MLGDSVRCQIILTMLNRGELHQATAKLKLTPNQLRTESTVSYTQNRAWKEATVWKYALKKLLYPF